MAKSCTECGFIFYDPTRTICDACERAAHRVANIQAKLALSQGKSPSKSITKCSCLNCKHWKCLNISSGEGICRRFPPAAIYTVGNDELGEQRLWIEDHAFPKTLREDVCGEWSVKP